MIEIEGGSHAENIEYDEERTGALDAMGLTVVRYANDDIMRNIEGVCNDLVSIIRVMTERT